jgi:hypothetical protein
MENLTKKQLIEKIKILENKVKKTGIITDRIKTFEDACDEIGINPSKFNSKVKNLDKDTIAYEKLKIIAKVLNEGWQPDWNDSNECKYYPWFKMAKSAFGFSHTGYDFADTYAGANIGSRLCLKSSELSDYFGKQFESIWKDYLV